MLNRELEENNRNRVKINGSIIIPESYSKEEFSKRFYEFIKNSNFDFIGEIGDLIPIIKLQEGPCNKELIIIWNDVLQIIQEELTEVSFNTWLKPITPYTIDGDKLILLVENHFIKGILEGRYTGLIKSGIKLVISKEIEVVFYVKEEVEIQGLMGEDS